MANLLIRHKVADYDAWKKVFDEFIETRRESGETSWRIWHPHDDPNNIVLLFGWESTEKAKAFMARSDLKAAMEEAGVLEPPDFYFLDELDRGKTVEE